MNGVHFFLNIQSILPFWPLHVRQTPIMLELKSCLEAHFYSLAFFKHSWSCFWCFLMWHCVCCTSEMFSFYCVYFMYIVYFYILYIIYNVCLWSTSVTTHCFLNVRLDCNLTNLINHLKTKMCHINMWYGMVYYTKFVLCSQY